jgi:uncharacterized protein YaaR (DUF327 family)
MYRNILEIDNKIRELFCSQKEVPQELCPRGEELTFWFTSLFEKQHARENRTYEFYLTEVLHVLKQYEEELFRPVVIDFHRRSKQAPRAAEQLIEELSRQYSYNISLIQVSLFAGDISTVQKNCCAEPTFVLEDNDFYVCCAACGRRFELNNITSNYGDCNRLVINHKNSNDKRNHFSECIDNFQGIQKSEISEDFLKSIEDHLCSFRLVNEEAPTRVEKFARVKKEHIRNVLKSMGAFKKRKEDINIIYKIITEQPFPKINHLKNKLLEDFDIFDARYNQLFPQTDQSAYHYYLILFQLLSYYNFPCKRSDFNFLKTAERKFSHEQKYKRVFESLGWNYQSLF